VRLPSWAFLKRCVVALPATGATVVPVVIDHFMNDPWDLVTLIAYVGSIYVGCIYVLTPDPRAAQIRDTNLDATFAISTSAFGAQGTDNPFRMFVFIPRGILWWRKLIPAYSCNAKPSQADFGISWPKGHGLVWKVYDSGQALWCHRDDNEWQVGCQLTDKEMRATKHVYGVFAIPLRQAVQSEQDALNSRVIAVLSFDATTPEAAVILKAQFDDFSRNQNHQLLDRASLVSIYF